MPPRSATRPIRPSSASISRTKCPLPSPPIAGLHDIAPTVANRWVTSAVRAPMRAAAAAASQPACPPPITMTSKLFSIRRCFRCADVATRGRSVKARAPPLPGGVGSEHFARLPGWAAPLHPQGSRPALSRRRIDRGFLFHVKHLLPDTEVGENNVNHILDVDPSGDPTESPRREPQLLRDQVLLAPRPLLDRPLQRLDGFGQRRPVPGPRDDARLSPHEHP